MGEVTTFSLRDVRAIFGSAVLPDSHFLGIGFTARTSPFLGKKFPALLLFTSRVIYLVKQTGQQRWTISS